MADSDTGGGKPYGKRRRYRDEDDYDHRPQRRRYEEPLVTKLKKALLAIAESPMRNAQEEAKDLAQTVSENFEDEEVKKDFTDMVVKLVLEQPLKIPFVAAMVLYANEMKAEFAREVLSRASAKLQDVIDDGHWREVKLLLRFFACLQSLLEGNGVFPILDELFNRAVDMQAASSEDAVGLELVKVILYTIPYVLASPAVGYEQTAMELLEKTDIVASATHSLETLVDPYPEDTKDKPYAYRSIIGLLQKQLQREAASGWELACIPRLFKPVVAMEENSDLESTSVKHPFPAVTVPSPVNSGPKPLFPEAYFSLYADQDVETVPCTKDIAASLLRDSLVDTINILDFNRIATAKFLIDVDCFWAPDTFVKRATPFDRLRDASGDKTTWKPEDLAVDALFSQIFQLPTAVHKLVYYHSVITESCKIAPAAIAPSLGRAIRFLFRNIDVMDMELSYRFMDWFSHHLSNFEFRWKWTEWLGDIDRNNLHPKKSYIIGALDKEIRLSFAKRIRQTLPAPYHPLIPEGKEKDTPDFKYDSDDTPYAFEGREILSLLRKKAPEEEIQHVIDSIHTQAAENGVNDVLVPSTDAYMTSICLIGSKSLSHVLSCIERCKERLLSVGPQSEGARKQIVQSVADYWKDQPGIAVNIVDKLLNYTIVSPLCVADWALGPDRFSGGSTPHPGSALSESWVYEMVAGTVGKVTNRVRQIVAARLQGAALPKEQVDLLNETLAKERDAMRVLFRVIEDAVSAIDQTAVEDTVSGRDGLDIDEGKLVSGWAQRWAKVFKRKAAVEEAVVGEQSLGL